MGAEASSENSGLAYGWRVLRVVPNSPCAKVELHPWFDFIVAAQNRKLDEYEMSLISLIQEYEDKPVVLTVFNYRDFKSREVTVIPSHKWGGSSLLGLETRFDSFENLDEQVLHVLKVYPNSPASACELKVKTDYLLGTVDIVFKSHEELDYAIGQSLNVPLDVFVFNSETKQVREVQITPRDDWGGQGRIGCSVAHGNLHRLPLDRPSDGELLNVRNGNDEFDMDDDNDDEKKALDSSDLSINLFPPNMSANEENGEVTLEFLVDPDPQSNLKLQITFTIYSHGYPPPIAPSSKIGDSKSPAPYPKQTLSTTTKTPQKQSKTFSPPRQQQKTTGATPAAGAAADTNSIISAKSNTNDQAARLPQQASNDISITSPLPRETETRNTTEKQQPKTKKEVPLISPASPTSNLLHPRISSPTLP